MINEKKFLKYEIEYQVGFVDLLKKFDFFIGQKTKKNFFFAFLGQKVNLF